MDTVLQADGGINDKTFHEVIEAGAEGLVVGSYMISSENYHEVVKKLKGE